MEWGAGALIISIAIVAVGIIGVVVMVVLFRAEETDGSQLERLRSEYLKLAQQYDYRYADYDCGITLAEHLCVDLSEWSRRMYEIAVEVDAIVKEVRAHGTDPFVKMGRL